MKELYYSRESFFKLAEELYGVWPGFCREEFVRDGVFGLEDLELKQRVSRVAEICAQYLPEGYAEALRVLREYVRGKENDFYYLFLPEFVLLRGKNEYDLSMEALAEFTQYSSSEFAVRYFIQKDLKRAFSYLHKWAESENLHLRRLVSEGTRPRLPWAQKIAEFIDNPNLTVPLLEKLKDDKEKYVQKSVANHLNDISKDNPEFLLGLYEKWLLQADINQWIIKHGARTLLKSGHMRMLSLLGYEQNSDLELHDFTLTKDILNLGDEIGFSFLLKSTSSEEQDLLIYYRLYFRTKTGKTSTKLFKLKEIELKSFAEQELKAKYSFSQKSIRSHFAGSHAIEIVINGTNYCKKVFELL